jgi:hypothetical protein
LCPDDQRDAEVHDDDAPGARHHDVLRLDVTMHEPRFVDRLESGQELRCDLPGVTRVQGAGCAQELGDRAPVHVLHGQELLAFFENEVVDPTYVGGNHLASRTHFVPQHFKGVLVRELLAAQRLQGHLHLQLQVEGVPHLAHAATPERANDAVAFAEDFAGCKWCVRLMGSAFAHRWGDRSCRVDWSRRVLVRGCLCIRRGGARSRLQRLGVLHRPQRGGFELEKRFEELSAAFLSQNQESTTVDLLDAKNRRFELTLVGECLRRVHEAPECLGVTCENLRQELHDDVTPCGPILRHERCTIRVRTQLLEKSVP